MYCPKGPGPVFMSVKDLQNNPVDANKPQTIIKIKKKCPQTDP